MLIVPKESRKFSGYSEIYVLIYVHYLQMLHLEPFCGSFVFLKYHHLVERHFFTSIFMPQRSKIGGHIVLSLNLEFDTFLETLTLLITFEQWVLELWYFTWVFLVIRPFRGYHYFLSCDLDLGDPFFENFNLVITFEKLVLYCTWEFLVTESSYWYQDTCPCDLDHLWNWSSSGAFVFHKHILFFSIFKKPALLKSGKI